MHMICPACRKAELLVHCRQMITAYYLDSANPVHTRSELSHMECPHCKREWYPDYTETELDMYIRICQEEPRT